MSAGCNEFVVCAFRDAEIQDFAAKVLFDQDRTGDRSVFVRERPELVDLCTNHLQVDIEFG